MVPILVPLVVLILSQAVTGTCNKDDVVLIHVLFRHGDRTTDAGNIYKNDPYKNHSYYPYGLGQLTNDGKWTEYNIGIELAAAYHNFLGPLYTPDLLYAQTTDYSRTKSSLELVLAGLFPPANKLVWNKRLLWQPIPYHFEPVKNDHLLTSYLRPEYQKAYETYTKSNIYQMKLTYADVLLKYLKEHTGEDMRSLDEIYILYFCLTTEEEFGLKLPPWTELVWPELIKYYAIRTYYEYLANDDLKRYAAGPLLSKIINDTQAKRDGTLEPAGRKIFLYSAHEINLAQLLITLGVFYPHIPPYGAYVVLEVHNVAGSYGIKVLYQDYKQVKPKVLQLPNCTEICPFDQFYENYKKYLD